MAVVVLMGGFSTHGNLDPLLSVVHGHGILRISQALSFCIYLVTLQQMSEGSICSPCIFFSYNSYQYHFN